MVLLRVLATALWLAATLVAGRADAQTSDPQRTAQQAQAKRKLDAVRARIRQISVAQKDTNIKKNSAVAALREQELKVAATARELRALDRKLTAQQIELDDLMAQRTALDAKLKTQRAALAALLRSAYALGRGEELKLLLAQDRIDRVGRMLAYYRYFEHARMGEINGLLKDLDSLAQVQAAIERKTTALKTARDERNAQAQQLDAERAQRRRVLDALDASLKDQRSRLAALGKDEKGLLNLIEKLRDVFADIPKRLAGEEPFAQLRGRLGWPLHGRVAVKYGAHEVGAQASQGVLIAAAAGSDVHAVSHGRVVFADWLRGYGLLLILDHGDGYLSLYGYNETLLKEVGDWVDSGDIIATSGDSGGRQTPGLYFELRHQGKPVDPENWLKTSR